MYILDYIYIQYMMDKTIYIWMMLYGIYDSLKNIRLMANILYYTNVI